MEQSFSISQTFTAIGIVLMILETVAPGFVMLPMGIGFLITAGIAPLVPGLAGQLLILAGSQIATFIFFSKVVKPKMKKQRHMSNVESLVGMTGTVEEEINPKAQTGYVKIYGDSWKAITTDGSTVKSGERVTIERLDGNKVFVRKA